MAKRVFPVMVFVPGNGLVLDPTFTHYVPVEHLGSNKTTRQNRMSCRKSLGT